MSPDYFSFSKLHEADILNLSSNEPVDILVADAVLPFVNG